MLKNTLINRKATKKVALALGELNNKVVYVGGAVVSLYIDDHAADDVRPTKDVDISLEIASLGELESLRQTLIEKGFKQSAEDDVMCRFRYKDVKVDVMATEEIGWAPGNPWFAEGFQHYHVVTLDEVPIKLLPLPYFLAAKFSAFYDRGGEDPRTSHDFEDIVYLLNYTSDIKDSILASDEKVRVFLGEAFEKVLKNSQMQEAILGNLFYEDQTVRYERIIHKLKEIVDVIQ